MTNPRFMVRKREIFGSGKELKGLRGDVHECAARAVTQIETAGVREDRSRTGTVAEAKVPVIVLSGHTAALGVIRALGSMGVPLVNVYYEKRDIGYISKYIKEKIYAPHPERDEEQFVNLLVDYSKKIGRALLLPADDAMLSAVSKNKPLLENHYLVACPDREITERIIDKKHTYELAERIGIAAPRTLIPKSQKDLESFAGHIDYPCLVKPRQSHRYYEVFNRKMVKVQDFDEMVSAYRQASDAGIEVMLQEYIPGDDTHGVNYNSYFCHGRPLVEFTAAKVRLSPPEFGVPSVVMSQEIEGVLEPGRKLLHALGFQGFSCVEFKKDPRDGAYKLMEVNGRHNRSSHLAVCCGINFPWLEYQHLVNGQLPIAGDYRKNIYWIDEFRDLAWFAKFSKEGRFPWIRYARPYVRTHVFAVFNLKDPKPFLKRCFDVMAMAFKRAFGNVKSNSWYM